MMTKLPMQFSFAGFSFPRYIPELSTSKFDKRTSRSVYYHAPRPEQAGKGRSFYLNDSASPASTRWRWCDDVTRAIKHTGWYIDELQYDKIRGLVVLLPHGRFLAGWSMGEGMASEVDATMYLDEVDAALSADSLAQGVAEQEQVYQEEQADKLKAEEFNKGGDSEEETY